MAIKITDKFCDFLNSYCSRSIWNEPQREYRHNIKLTLQETRPQINVWSRGTELVSLPTTNTQYFVYMAPLSHFAGLDVRSSDWQTVTTLLHEKRIQLRFHDSTGKRLISNFIYLRSSGKDTEEILIAVDKRMLVKCVDTDEADLYVGVYFDSDEPNNITSESWMVTDINESSILRSVGSNTSNLILIHNGYVVNSLYNDNGNSALAYGDYVEVIRDENILASFQLDLSQDKDAATYITKDFKEKYIIHIPKALNPHNYLISHDTCDFYIFPRNLTNGIRKGRYFHRAQGSESKSFIQLTHNDFGLPIELVDGYRAHLNTDEVILKCYIRSHAFVYEYGLDENEKQIVTIGMSNKLKSLVRDKHYLDYLYQIDDDNKIISFLQGNGPDVIDCWKASELEDSNYIAILKDTSNQQLTNTMSYYTEALGYVQTAALLCSRIYRYTGIKAIAGYSRNLALPLAYQWKSCPKCHEAVDVKATVCTSCGETLDTDYLFAMVYINGIKVPFSQVYSKIVTAAGSNGMKVPMLEVQVIGLSINKEDEVSYVLYEKKPFTTFIHTPSAINDTLLIPKGTYKCYEEITVNPLRTPGASDITKGYKALNITSTDQGELTKLIFPADTYGKCIVIQTAYGSYTNYTDLASLVSTNRNLVYTPQDDGHEVTQKKFTPTAENRVYTTNFASYGVSLFCENKNITSRVSCSHQIDGSYIITFDPDSSDIMDKEVTMLFYSLTIKKPVLTDENMTLYMNGRLLVEGTDFHRCFPKKYDSGADTYSDAGDQPYLYIIHNVSYITDQKNYVEAYGTDHLPITYSTDFMTSEKINSKYHPTWYNSKFSEVYTDGQHIANITWTNGRLINNSTVVPSRNGALYAVKTLIPPIFDASLQSGLSEDEYALFPVYLEEDMTRINAIAAYFAKLTNDDPAIYPIHHSHRLYSVYLNTVIDNVLDGRLQLPSETEISKLMEYLTDYNYLLEYDLPLKFNVTDELDINGNRTGRKIRTSCINRTFIDTYPSYTQRLVEGSSLYYTLNALIEYITPADPVVDTEAVDTTVYNNQGNK